MNLNNFSTTHNMKQKRFHKIFESRFGRKINFDKLQVPTAVKMVKKLDETLARMKKSKGYQIAERSSRYSETLLLKEGLDNWLHIQLGIAHKQKLTEGEIETAEAVLAAKDFVDRLQKMLEDIGRIINEDLPPLSDVVRDQLGTEQADAYSQSATSALAAIQSAISDGRGEMDRAARALAGEQDAAPAGDMDMPADDLGDEEPTDDLDLDMDKVDMDDNGGDDFDMDDAAVGGDLNLGRAER